MIISFGVFRETKQDRKCCCSKLGMCSMLDGEEAQPLWRPWPFIALAHIQFILHQAVIQNK